jgi:hypothetical protein
MKSLKLNKEVYIMEQLTVYQENGFKNRKEYLRSLTDDYGVSYSTVVALANVLGPTEDFDGLLTSLEDAGE